MSNQPHSQSEGTARRSHILTTLLTDHRAVLLRQAAANTYRPDDVEDALQDACVQFLANYEGPPGTGALRWMMLVTKRCAWAIAARERRHESSRSIGSGAPETPAGDTGADPGLDPAVLFERRERHEERRAALGRLRPDQRTALGQLAAGYSYKEIAERRSWTYTKVNRCVREGRAALRD